MLGRECVQSDEELLSLGCVLAADDLVQTVDEDTGDIVGAGMQSNPGVAARMFEALYSANVNIQQISTSEIRVTVLIDREDTDRAMNAVHNEFDF